MWEWQTTVSTLQGCCREHSICQACRHPLGLDGTLPGYTSSSKRFDSFSFQFQFPFYQYSVLCVVVFFVVSSFEVIVLYFPSHQFPLHTTLNLTAIWHCFQKIQQCWHHTPGPQCHCWISHLELLGGKGGILNGKIHNNIPGFASHIVSITINCFRTQSYITSILYI